MRITGPSKTTGSLMVNILNEHETLWCAPISSPQGQAPGFPHGWLKVSSSNGYPHYDWVGHSGRVHWKMKCWEGHPPEHYSGLRRLNLGVLMGSGLRLWVLSHPL